MKSSGKPFKATATGEAINRSERSSLILSGSSCGVCLPLTPKFHVELESRVKTGESLPATLE